MGDDRSTVLLLRLVVVLLAVQFILGIWVNLFGTFPSTRGLGAAVRYSGDPVLTGHYVLAVVLVALAVVLMVVAFRRESSLGLRGMVVAGAGSIVWAVASGLQFVLSGFSNNVASFSMAVAFIAATSFYGVAQALVLAPPSGSQRRSVAADGPPGPP